MSKIFFIFILNIHILSYSFHLYNFILTGDGHRGVILSYEALDKKIYFKEATILVPPQWNSKHFTKARTEFFEKVYR